jgi:GMP synthase (glutamine-hydrolysing)
MRRTLFAIRHVHFEDLGTFEAVLSKAGYEVRYHDVGAADLAMLDAVAPDLLVLLGGPIGVYDTAAYPFLELERHLIAQRLAARRPLLGICLGAQQVAAALGARVAPMGVKEIGFAPVSLTEAGTRGPLRHLDGVAVLHWHGDAFETPPGAVNLATTQVCPAQAFAYGPHVLGLQFHPEADASAGLEPWLIGHAAELAAAGIDTRGIRADAARHGPSLREAARATLTEWLEQLPA